MQFEKKISRTFDNVLTLLMSQILAIQVTQLYIIVKGWTRNDITKQYSYLIPSKCTNMNMGGK